MAITRGAVGTRTYQTPFGLLAVVADDEVVLSSGFQPLASALARLGDVKARRAQLPEISDAIAAYLDGDLDVLTRIHTRQAGSEFAQAAWRAMRKIRAGRTLSYAELADRAGSPRAVRAAGTACARNFVAPFVPCHRVVKSGGALGNYGYGVSTKAALLEYESAR